MIFSNVWHNISKIYNGPPAYRGAAASSVDPTWLDPCCTEGMCQGQNSMVKIWVPFPHKGLSEHQLGKVDNFED